mgnify:CR=1 FL=1
MKRKIGLLVILLLILCGMLLAGTNKGYHKDVYSEHYVPVEEVQDELSFSIYKEMDWEQILLQKQEYLTKKAASEILEFLGLKDYIQLPEKSENAALDRGEWNAVYTEILAYLDDEKTVTTQDLLLMDVIESDSGCILVTNEGDYPSKFGQHFLTAWDNYRLYLLDGKCVGLRESVERKQRYIILISRLSKMEHLLFYPVVQNMRLQWMTSEKDVTEGVADLVFSNGKLQIRAKKMNRRSVENYCPMNENTIEIEGYGRISHTGKIPVYELLEGEDVTESSISKVVLGNMEVSYVIGEEEVCAILIRTPAVIENIRVLLLADDGGKFRSAVYLKADVDASIKFGETVSDYAAGTLLDVSTWFTERDDTFSIQPATENGKIFLCDEAGNTISNGYSGSVEVRRYEEGYTVVNSVPFETYLTAVVPSEMPSTYEKEALKAQAVCARSYAYIQLMRADLAAFGAHINDSTSYQVYNKVEAGEASRQAVEETKHEVMTYADEVIEAYYFSTSMGYTDTAEVWNPEEMENYGYLKKVCLNTPETDIDLSDEKTFLDYIRKPQTGFDSEIKYYRWSAQADFNGKEAGIRQILENRHSISPRNVIYYESNGKNETDSMADFGKLKGIEVEKRSASGSILTLRLSYEHGMVKVFSEYNIRKVLGLGAANIAYQDGSESAEVTILPSAFASLVNEADETYTLYGGGYGHGLGMSQNGANGLAKNRDELSRYFAFLL